MAGKPSDGCTPAGKRRRDLLQAFADELAGEVHRHGIVKDHGDHGEAELRERAHFFLVRQSEHGTLDRIGHQLFDFARRQGRRFGDDHDLIVGEIGEGFDGNGVQRVTADPQQNQDADQHEPAIGEREINDAIEHGRAYSLSMVDFRSCDFRTKLPLHDDLLARFEPFEDRRLAVGRFPDAHRTNHKAIGGRAHEDDVLVIDLLDGIGGHQQNPACARADRNFGIGKHFRLQPIVPGYPARCAPA